MLWVANPCAITNTQIKKRKQLLAKSDHLALWALPEKLKQLNLCCGVQRMSAHAQVLGEQEVPVELVRHMLSFLVGHADDDIAPWVRTTWAVCQLWRSVSLDLVRDHTARLWSSLPPPHPDLRCTSPPPKAPTRSAIPDRGAGC